MSKPYQICTRCIMDTTDPDIAFDAAGVCNHCHNYDKNLKPLWTTGEAGQKKLDALIEAIKKEGHGKEYDCIIGLSGGVDSSYLAYLLAKKGLRILAVHVDAGWNTEIAVKNIENLCKKLKIDLITEVIDWDAMRELQKAFFRSQVVNQDIPQDHAFFAALYKYATKNKIKYVLNGYNISTECVLPEAWRGYPAIDKTHVSAIYSKYGNGKLKGFPLLSAWKLRMFYRVFHSLRLASPLNFMDYSKEKALAVLEQEIGFSDYGGKHMESKFTRFHQSYFLPQRFGFDKRRAHLSALVLTGQASREEALERIQKPLYPSIVEQENDIEYFIKKIDMSREEFDRLMTGAPDRHENFPSEIKLNHKFDKFSAFISRMLKR